MKLLRHPRTKLLAASLLLAAATLAHAREFRLPDGKPAASIELPDAWQPALIARGVQVKSPDGSVFLSVEATGTAEEMTRIIDETDATLKAHKVRLDRASRESRKSTVNGLPVEELRFTGRDEQGAAVVGITFVSVGGRALVLTRWASADGDSKHQPELARMLASIRAVKP